MRDFTWHHAQPELARSVLCVAPMTYLHTHSRNTLSIALAALAIAFAGCATGSQQVREQRPAGVWQVRLPASQGLLDSYAAGRATGIAADDARRPANIDAYLKPEYAKATAPKASRASKRVPEAIAKAPDAVPTLVATPLPAAPPPIVEAASPPQEYASRTDSVRDDLERYAQRDARAERAKDFRGGDVVVISVGTLILVLLIVLLVVLLVR
jgi:hypothetical protein